MSKVVDIFTKEPVPYQPPVVMKEYVSIEDYNQLVRSHNDLLYTLKHMNDYCVVLEARIKRLERRIYWWRND